MSFLLSGLLRLRSDPRNVPSRLVLPTQQRRVRGDTIVLDNHRSWCPLNATLQVLRQCYVVIQKLKQIVTFLLLESNDVACTLRVNLERLLTCDGVGTNQRVDRSHGRTPHNTAACEGGLSLFMARVQSFETLQALTEGG